MDSDQFKPEDRVVVNFPMGSIGQTGTISHRSVLGLGWWVNLDGYPAPGSPLVFDGCDLSLASDEEGS